MESTVKEFLSTLSIEQRCDDLEVNLERFYRWAYKKAVTFSTAPDAPDENVETIKLM